MYEHRSQPLLPRKIFFRRLLIHGSVALGIIAGSLAIGVLGYHFLGGLEWIDALHNASMILGGMGPIDHIDSTAGKIFASCYALYSGMLFLVIASILLGPIVHRFLHRLHLEQEEDEKEQ
jgi:hypothetical protein